MNISSIVVHTKSEYLEEVITSLNNCGVCDYHMHDKEGRIIVTIEGRSVEEELKKLRVIESIPYIASANMQMAYSADELNTHMNILENATVVPSVLSNNEVKVEDIMYNGDLKKKDLYEYAKNFL